MSTSNLPVVVNVNEYKNETDEPLLEPSKPRKVVKVLYFKDQNQLQLSLDFNKERNSEDGLISQLKHTSFYQGCLTELLGTYLLVLFAIGFGLNMDPIDTSNEFTGALASGFLVATIIWFFPTCHINPAVSISFLVAGKANLVRVLFYIPSQLMGSTLAVKTIHNMIIDNPVVNENVTATMPEIGLTLLNPKLGVMQGLATEVIVTFVLLITIFSCSDKSRTDLSGSFPLTVGFSVTIGILFAAQFTGAAMNPSRAFGPALVANNFENHFVVYWLGPICGAVLAAVVYKLLTFKTSVRVE